MQTTGLRLTPHRTPVRSPQAAVIRCHASADRNPSSANEAVDHRSTVFDRRCFLLSAGATAAIGFGPVGPAVSGEDLATYYGQATPPTSYGGYGGNANEPPKYKFDHPASWREQPVNKVEKGTQGIDCKLTNPRSKGNQVFVITLGRAGEDEKSFQLRDADTTFQGFVGADYNLQDAIQSATKQEKTERDIDGQKYYEYDIQAPDVTYLSSVTVKGGKVFAFFLRTPTRLFDSDEKTYRGMLASFRTL